MQSKPKILVLKMRELVYTGIFLFLAVVLIVLLVLMFRTEKAPEKRTGKSLSLSALLFSVQRPSPPSATRPASTPLL